MYKKIITLILFIFVFSVFVNVANAAPDADALVFFANKASVKTDSLTLKELEQIYLSKMTAWPDKKSGNITAFNLAIDSPERAALQKLVLKMSGEDEKKYWIQKRIEGKENPPESKKTAVMVQMMVSKMEGAIGYCFYKDIQDNIKGDLLFLKIDGNEGLK
ncbi:MAG TPA: hypothetical protein PLM75_09140 [bacterium]|nr:hypothetical protein [bacterium]HPP88008.1 hypothetical protein [bacterium]